MNEPIVEKKENEIIIDDFLKIELKIANLEARN